MNVEFHEDPDTVSDPRERVYVRTAYRNQPDFVIKSIGRVGSAYDARYPQRMIDNDERVSDNYQRLIGTSLDALYGGQDDHLTVEQVRERYIGELRDACNAIFRDLVLEGPGDPLDGGTFLFCKGAVSGFPYMNLSGGEKAVFDLLLDLLVKRTAFANTVFCIDEPEAHLNTAVQGDLLEALYRQVNDRSQLWIATHSIGMLRRARDLYDAQPESVAFLDFGDRDFDSPVTLTPVDVNRAFWERTLSVALGDISELVAPRRVVLCEGADGPEARTRRGFDAACLKEIFGERMPDTAFVAVGNDDDVSGDRLGLARALQALVRGAAVVPLIDRDHRSPQEVAELATSGVRVLMRRSLESYLLDDEVLVALCADVGQPERTEELLMSKQRHIEDSVARGNPMDDLKSARGPIVNDVRRLLALTGAGNTADAFLRDTLAPLIEPGMVVYEELRRDIFG